MPSTKTANLTEAFKNPNGWGGVLARTGVSGAMMLMLFWFGQRFLEQNDQLLREFREAKVAMVQTTQVMERVMQRLEAK